MPQLAAWPRVDWAFLHLGATLGLERDSKWRVAGEDAAGAFRNLQFQQNLPAAGVAVVVLRAGSTRLAETLPLMSPLLALLPQVKAGTVTFVPSS